LWKALGLVFLGWTLYAALEANQITWMRAINGAPPVAYVNLLRYSLVSAWLWALLTLPIVALARRFPVTSVNWWHRVPLHVVFAIAVHGIVAASLYFGHPFLRPGGPRYPLAPSLLSGLFFDAFVYGGIVATWHALFAQGQTSRLKSELLEAELRMLRMQLQPHFLFNTMNAVSELIHRDPARAERALARLGDLLRWSLQSSSLHEVTLREELEALEIYLDIQRLRHGEGLVLAVDAEPAALELAVPSLLLQPLVENAIRHGVRGAARGRVEIDARREDGRLRLAVSDDGIGIAAGFDEGTGLRATRARLEGLYGAEQSMRIAPAPTGGTRVEVTIPAHAAGEATRGVEGAP
jgi:signal transduction histidine kinase